MLDLAKLTESTFTEAVTFTLDNAEYEASYRGGDKPRRLRIESKYGLCFEIACCSSFLKRRSALRRLRSLPSSILCWKAATKTGVKFAIFSTIPSGK